MDFLGKINSVNAALEYWEAIKDFILTEEELLPSEILELVVEMRALYFMMAYAQHSPERTD